MKLRNRPVLVALIYILSSIFIGPAIYLTGYFLVQNSDHCGGSNRVVVPDHPISGIAELPRPAEKTERRMFTASAYRFETAARGTDIIAAQAFSIGSAGIMLAIGIFLWVRLWCDRRRIGHIRLILAGAGILVMIFGYGLTMAAGFSNTSCT
ncbi:hypothetical protein [Nocardia amamiensis]|uniref:hypothetical protein n=1 Tax=Nocardia amamiensis TaxID=404578 RepID=UPI000834F632|nr:hypothetical protein [Nocardia amamiensis]